ncbi:NACHT domain-containing protein [Pyxidicoccus caerfyrddinensis]|uniref:NACHT domain-containing protein n=1 Tax=Pyxidicoccus caerfyrddinensis TaxID=2709663 RepID=UPI0013DC1DD6|nr:TIR domain-containing protein [Pyxidicoccus caerfyrddinensis]
MAPTPKVFISHTTRDPRDAALARSLDLGLRERGAEVWIAPRSIPIGAEWEPHLVQGLMEQSTHFLVLLSAASVTSEWVLKEVELARKRYAASGALRILPLRLGEPGAFAGADFLSLFQEVPRHDDPITQLDSVAVALGLPSRRRTPVSDIRYRGKRFWLPRGETIRLSFDGFLPDPESDDWTGWNPKIFPFESISKLPCLVLLGEPGTGKSTALKSIDAGLFQGSDDDSSQNLLVDLKECTSEALLDKYLFQSAGFLAWRNSEGTLNLFLDSLDECLIHIQAVARNLLTELGRCPVKRLRLRIACRTAEWPELLSHELPELWGKEHFGAYEIAPLRRVDVAEAALIEGFDPEAFLKAVTQRDAVPLAIKPITLKLLLSSFKEDRRLPDSLRALYEKGCLRLCEEFSLDRAASKADGKLPSTHRLRLAERIAAVTLLCKRPAMYLGQDASRAPEESATLDALSYGYEKIGGKPVPVMPEHIRETLQTGLFTGGTSERLVTWSHWTFPEFLAARFLVTRRMTTTKLKELLLRPDTSGKLRIIPPLQEMVGWLAGMSPEFFQELVPIAPEFLLRSTATTIDTALKARLVESLLEQLNRQEVADFEDMLRHRYDFLKHPSLGLQLASIIKDRSKSFLARVIAINIAGECGESSLLGDLLQLALDESENLDIRCASIEAMGAMGNQEAFESLRPLLRTEGDPEKELAARVLHILWPMYLSAEGLFELLSAPRNTHHFGTYAGFLYRDVAEHLKPEDLPVALRWVESRGNGFYFDPLVEAILRKSWEHLDAPGVLREFGVSVLSRLKLHRPLFGDATHRRRAPDPLLAEPDKRRILVQELLGQLEHPRLWLINREPFISSGDLRWLTQQLEQTADPQLHERWLKLIEGIFSLDDLEHVDLILEVRQRIPSLARQFAWCLDAVELGSPQAASLRARQQQRESQNKRRGDERAHQPPSQNRVRHLLGRFEAGDLIAWHRISLELARSRIKKRRWQTDDELQANLSALPGWEALDENLRARCISAAERYLRDGEPRTAEWFGTGESHRWATAGYRALRLLLAQKREVLAGWPTEQWTPWVPLVIDWPWEQDGKEKAVQETLVAHAYVRAPEAFISAVLEWLDKASKNLSVYTLLKKLASLWDPRLVDALVDWLGTGVPLEPSALGVLLNELVPRSPKAFEQALRWASSAAVDEAEREKKLEAASSLLNTSLQAAWPHLWPLMQANPAFGEQLLTRSEVYRARREQQLQLVGELDENAIAELYVWLWRRFPPADNRNVQHFQITGLRNALLGNLKQRGTQAAVSAVRRIAESLPEVPGLKLAVQQADEQRLRYEWKGLEPEELLALVEGT